MRQIPIRALKSDVIQAAAERGERLSLTNNHLVCGVLVPVDRLHLARVLDQNLSRLAHSIELAEKELDNGEPAASLDSALEDEPVPAWSAGPKLRQVRLGELSGALVEEAAASGERLAITNNHQVCAVLIPMSRQWVNQVAERSLSRLVRNAERGEQDLAAGDVRQLDDVLVEFPEAVSWVESPEVVS